MDRLFLWVVVLWLLVSFVEARRHWNWRFCKDESSYSDCKFYKTLGMCKAKEYFPVLAERCPKTCDLCTFGLERKPDGCKDKDTPQNCDYLKKHGACQSHSNIMADRCARTCKLCDARHKCAEKQCNFNEVCVLDEKRQAQCVCPKYCPNKKGYQQLGNVCGSDGKTYKDFCHLQHHSCRDNNNITVNKYGLCPSDIPCEDRKLEKEQGMCDAWKAMNFCGDPFYQNIMLKYCKRTCGNCNEGKIPHQGLRGKCANKALSPYGCCWDLTDKPDPRSGRGCPVCKDDYAFCERFVKQCNSVKNLSFMKQKCPVTCGFCTPTEKPEVTIKIYNNYGTRIFTTKVKTRNDS